MYRRMTEKQRVLILTFAIFISTLLKLYGKDSSIILGESDLWSSVKLNNLSLVDGKRGYYDLINSDYSHSIDRDSDLILEFNNPGESESTGNYRIASPVKIIAGDGSYGGGAAFFDGEEPVLIEPVSRDALFSPSSLWEDFSLEFRLFPATLREGSTIFLWKGLQMIGDRLIPQEIRCTVSNRRLVWDFDNFFLYPDNTINRVSLEGEKLIPGQWSHHLLVFDSRSGLLEYRIGNIPTDSTYTSKTGRESDEFNVPSIGNQQSFPLELGENFSGLIDELRITKHIINNPELNRFTPSGEVETGIIDLMIPGSTLLSIESEYNLPENTSIAFQYAISENKPDLLKSDIPWVDTVPMEKIGKTGRFVKIRARLTSEPAAGRAPVLTNLVLNYSEAALPYPPMNPSIRKEQGNLVLTWEKSLDPSIGGYMVYYGENPGEYLASGSPVDAGTNNSLTVKDLDLNKRYYFAITSYRSGETRLESRFSREITFSP